MEGGGGAHSWDFDLDPQAVNNGWSWQVSGVGAGSDCRTAQLQGAPFMWTTMRPRWAVRGPSIRQGYGWVKPGGGQTYGPLEFLLTPSAGFALCKMMLG